MSVRSRATGPLRTSFHARFIGEVIPFMRASWEEHGVAPDSRHVLRHLVQRYGPEARTLLFDLFPYGYSGQARRIAGMKRPRAWSTG